MNLEMISFFKHFHDISILMDELKIVFWLPFSIKRFIKKIAFIIFQGCSVNVGGGMDPDTGLFTAPLGGSYMFVFHIGEKHALKIYDQFTLHNK